MKNMTENFQVSSDTVSEESFNAILPLLQQLAARAFNMGVQLGMEIAADGVSQASEQGKDIMPTDALVALKIISRSLNTMREKINADPIADSSTFTIDFSKQEQ